MFNKLFYRLCMSTLLLTAAYSNASENSSAASNVVDKLTEQITTLAVSDKGKKPLIKNAPPAAELKDYTEQIYFTPSTTMLAMVQDLIGRTEEQIKAAYYRFTLYPVAQSMVQQKINFPALKLSLLVNSGCTGDSCAAIRTVHQGGGNVHLHKGSGIMHLKALLLRGVTSAGGKNNILLSGSWNATGQANTFNVENIMVTKNTDMITITETELDRLLKSHSRPIEEKDLYLKAKKKRSAAARARNKIPKEIRD